MSAIRVSTTLLLFIAGIIRDRLGHCDIERLGGLGEQLPALGGFSAVGFLTAVGTPGFCWFPALLMTLMASFEGGGGAGVNGLWQGVVGIAGVTVLAGTLIWTYQRIFLGAARPEHSNVAPLSLNERLLLALLALASLVLGVLPLLLTGPMRAAAERWVRTAQ